MTPIIAACVLSFAAGGFTTAWLMALTVVRRLGRGGER